MLIGLLFVGPALIVITFFAKIDLDNNRQVIAYVPPSNPGGPYKAIVAAKTPSVFFYNDVIVEFASKKISEMHSYSFLNVKDSIDNLKNYMLPSTYEKYFKSIGGDNFIDRVRRQQQYSVALVLPSDTSIIGISDTIERKEWILKTLYKKQIKYKNRQPRYLQKNLFMYIVMPKTGKLSGRLLISGLIDI
jgi:hypothetical protein